MDQCLKDMLNQTCTIAPWVSINYNCDNTYGTAVSNSCLTIYKTQMVTDEYGNEVVSKAYTVINGDAVVNTKSKITLPDSTTPKILKVEKVPDETGSLYYICIYT